MAVIIIKWSVMTADNPHMQPGHPEFTESQLFVNAPLKPKTHTDVCVWDKTTNSTERESPAFVSVLHFVPGLAYGNFQQQQQQKKKVQLFSTEPPY